jgi:hypothetical protein
MSNSDGYIELDDTIYEYIPEEMEEQIKQKLKELSK